MPVGSSRAGIKQRRKECRKIVPKHRPFDKKTAAGLIRFYAYDMDVTRKQLADAAGISDFAVNAMLITRPHLLKPKYIKIFSEVLALTDEETTQLYRMAAIEAGYLIGEPT